MDLFIYGYIYVEWLATYSHSHTHTHIQPPPQYTPHPPTHTYARAHKPAPLKGHRGVYITQKRDYCSLSDVRNTVVASLTTVLVINANRDIEKERYR